MVQQILASQVILLSSARILSFEQRKTVWVEMVGYVVGGSENRQAGSIAEFKARDRRPCGRQALDPDAKEDAIITLEVNERKAVGRRGCILYDAKPHALLVEMKIEVDKR